MVADKIRQLRIKVGIGQVELAKRVGVSQSMISQLENGSRAGKPDTMQAIAEELGCTFEELCDQPRPIIQFMRNCKRLSHPQLLAVNEIVLQLIGSGSPAENQGEAANNIQHTIAGSQSLDLNAEAALLPL